MLTFRRLADDACQIACSRALGQIRLPPNGVILQPATAAKPDSAISFVVSVDGNLIVHEGVSKRSLPPVSEDTPAGSPDPSGGSTYFAIHPNCLD